jgi:hypothetical protein
MRSDRYSSPDSADVNAEEFVAAPGHGAVGVFQAPQPVRPRGASVDTTLDIDSPFLDLFGSTPAPISAAPVSSPGPSPEPEADFDFGFDFDSAGTAAAPKALPPQPVSPPAPPTAAAPAPPPAAAPAPPTSAAPAPPTAATPISAPPRPA